MTVDHASVVARRIVTEGRDVPWLLQRWSTTQPEKTFLVWEPFDAVGRSWSYGEFAADVDRLAGALAARGVAEGERVLLHLENCPEFMLGWFACARIGAVAVSTNTRSVERDMRFFAEHAGVVAAITQPRFAELVAGSAPALRFLVVTDNDAGKAAEDARAAAHVSFASLLAEQLSPPERATQPLANLGIQYTSGTTSRPKAVLWTHANAIWGAQMNALHMRLQSDDICLTFLPLFHTNAQSYSMLGTLWVGGTLVLQPRFSASRFWEASVRNRCTWCSTLPFCVKALLPLPVPPIHHYRFWGPAVALPDADRYFRIATFGWWGMTETITHGIVGDPAHPGPLMCIGRPSPGYEIAIRRPDGSPVAPGERGALYVRGVRGVSMFKEYFNNPQANDKAFDADGWFDTGDLIRMDEQGNLFFGDRDKDMLKVGGENVAASEIEAVILATGWVNECAVVGQKHYMLDEVPVAFVIPLPGSPEAIECRLIEVCKANLADFKVVRRVHVVTELPRSTLEKIAKNVLRDSLPEITG